MVNPGPTAPVLALIWSQPLTPLPGAAISALVAALPVVVVLILMGVWRKSGLVAAGYGLLTTVLLACVVWRMPPVLAGLSLAYGTAFALWSILWLVFNALWLYHLAVGTGSFELLRRWMQQGASGDPCIQSILVGFCFGSLLEGSAGFGAPVAITAFLLVRLGFPPRRAVLVALIANTAPVAFGGVGIPIVALAGVTGLDLMKLSAMVGRQVPLLSLLLPAYLAWVTGGAKGLGRVWPVALVTGLSYAAAQFLVSNLWGPYATDILSALSSIAATLVFLRFWTPPAASTAAAAEGPEGACASPKLSPREIAAAWLPWGVMSLTMILWSHFNLYARGQMLLPVPGLHNEVLISLYGKPYTAIFSFQPLASGSAVLVTTFVSALLLRARPAALLRAAQAALQQLRRPGLAVLFIVALAYLYNYSGMAYTLGAAMAGVGLIFPFVSSYLGWVACFLTGSDTSSNLLFGNLQVAAAHQLNLSPVLMAATNSSGAVAGKMISPQNITVGVTTVGLVGEEGQVLQSAFWHSLLFAAIIGVLACAQAFLLQWMVP